MKNKIYIRMKGKVKISPKKEVLLRDIADFITREGMEDSFLNIPIYPLETEARQTVVIDGFHVIRRLSNLYEDYEYELIGGNETIIEINPGTKRHSILLISFVWLLLFIGTAMTIINFHYDVSMQEVQQRVHYLLTGKETKYPLFIQIPYSIGLGVGMIVFLNYWFRKKITDEPSPLEVELFNYERDIDDYKIIHEKKIDDQKHAR